MELGVGQGVLGWGRGGVQELDLKEGWALTCRLFPLPSDTTHQQRGVPGLQCEPGAGTSLRVELGGGRWSVGQGLSHLCCPSPRLPQNGCSGRGSSCTDISWPPAGTSSETESTTLGSIGEWRPCRPPGPTPLLFFSFSFYSRHLGLALLRLAELGLGLGRYPLDGELLPLSSPLLPFDSPSFPLSP